MDKTSGAHGIVPKFPSPLSATRSPIFDFYRNSTIFITGGTGFVGKVLVQKLLSSFPLKKIYVLIRMKDNVDINKRLEMFFKEAVFDDLRRETPELFEKVHPIYADFGSFNLNIAAQDREILIANVQIVFNVVASVKFNEKLSDAIEINVLGTKKILDLVMEMKCLKAFVHISTLYCNCNRKFISEQVYEPDIGYEKIVQLNRILDAATMEKLRHCLIGDMPNTYTMTKKCAEHLVNHRAFFLPAGIFRPPIVLSTYKDPFPGWTDNVYGPSGVCTWTAKGFVRCIWGNANIKANMVPADYCVNAIIAAAWDISRGYELRKREVTEIPVYNYIYENNNLTWGQYMALARAGFHEPFDKTLWYYSYIITPSKPVHRIVTFLVHNIPGYILDLIAMATGQKTIYSKAYRKIGKIVDMMSYFGLKEWTFTNTNIAELDSRLIAEERQLFEFNMQTIDWVEYFRNYLSGIRRYFFKESTDSSQLQQNRASYRRLTLLHGLFKSVLGLTIIVTIAKLYCKLFKIIPKIEI